MSSLLVGGLISSGMRMTNLRAAGERVQGTQAYACAEAGLNAGRDYYRARSAQWNMLIQQGHVFTEQAALPGQNRMQFEVRIFDNEDEFPPAANNPNIDNDLTVLLVSKCTDALLDKPVELRQYLTLNPIGSIGLNEKYGPAKYDLTTNPDPDGPSFSGNEPLDANGGLVSGSTQFSSSGIKAVGVDLRNDQLALSTVYTTLPFIWLSNSGDGTVSKINTETGVELGRYRTGPGNGNPSRTSVDLDGNVWVGNRNNNTITKIGLKEAGNCVDRNGNGVIDSSTGPNDVRPWTGTWGGGVAGAQDECVLVHVALQHGNAETPWDVRAVTVDKNNYVFAGGLTARGFYKLAPDGTIVASMNSHRGHYGAVADKDGNVWTMAGGQFYVERHNNNLTSVQQYYIGVAGYGIALDRNGRVWSSEWGNRFSRMNPDGSGLQIFYHTGCCAQGLAVANNGDVFIAGSLSQGYVHHYNNNGGFVYRYDIPGNPTGVAIDAAGKIWTSNYNTGTASRIDPVTRQIHTFLNLSYPYNYSDMTGFVARNFTARQGTWTVRQYCGASCLYWKSIEWKLKQMPAGTTVSVRARSALNVIGLANATWRPIINGQILPPDDTGLKGRVIEVEVKLTTTEDGVTPIVDWVEITPWS
ncbi:MAG: hypothetical protein RMK29_12650 [Myxococcales bacterium]|nr:hypothetical protein [Myxococcota bacterium]MDW8282554.1 hypothetical protein [Myxococcales bacterium]